MKLFIQLTFWLYAGRVVLWMQRVSARAHRWYNAHSPVKMWTPLTFTVRDVRRAEFRFVEDE